MRLMFPLLLLACNDKSTSSPAETTPADSGPTDSGEPIVDFCADEGLTVREFDASGTAGGFDTVVPDFTWNITDSEGLESSWTFSEQWSGCDSYMIINYYGDSNYPVELDNDREITDWLESSPRNVHYFFFSYDQEPEGVLSDLTEQLNSALDDLDDDLAEHWRDRIHYVVDSPWEADWVGGLNSQYYISGKYVQWALSIDRLGVARETGYFCDPSDGWATCPPEFLIYEPQIYNFESDREEELAAQTDVTIVDVWTDEPASDTGWAGVKIYADIELPDAATMATFDTMDFDLTLKCAGYPSGTECPAWDYLVYAYLCEIDDPETEEDESTSCPTEIGRWITTYWRPGRWVHDVSPFLALLQDGGTRRLAFYTTQYYDVSLDVRLSNEGKGYRPVGLEPIFDGGSFNRQYNWGVDHAISETEWTIGSHATDEVTYTISTIEDGWLTAESGGDWQRMDWTVSEEGAWYCHTAQDMASEEEAAAVTFACTEDDPKTKKDDESACVGADPSDLETGCNEGAWTALTGDASAGVLWGAWQEVWHDDKLPINFTPPEGTTQVGLMAIISGHGFGDTNANCAEFCDHQHAFTLNDGASHTKTHPEAGSPMGCAEQVVDGTVPNQSGTWVYGRGGWCPGMEVVPWVVDITDDVVVGEENTVSYFGLMDGEVWQPDSTGANIRMQSYLVYYE
ncbi:MAG: peptide-N-glycosidase F-related protein [Myxococcota bacterium]|nr:peptide-N-glycosidase F-related protein [Myxococcota bacterium]